MKISIVTPSFNQGQFIERTLKSVADQRSYLPDNVELEHIIFDGGSNDNTISILENFNPPVHFKSEPDKGQADAVNKGILASDGSIIGWLNSDDIYYPGALNEVLQFFTENPEIDLVYGMADHIDLNDLAFESYPTEPWNFTRLQETCFICQPAVFFRRRLFERHGLLNPKLQYCMDYEFWLRLSLNGEKFAYVPQKWAGSRLYADNKTLGSRVKVHAEINDMFKNLFGKVPDRWVFNYAHVVADNKKIDRKSTRFIWHILLNSTLASWKWNRRFLPTVKYPLFAWGRALLRGNK